MNQPTLLGKLLSPAGFGLVVLMFFLPFVAVSCGTDPHRVTATFNGLDMVTGNGPVYSGPDIQPGDQANLDQAFKDQYDNEPLGLLAAVVTLGGMITVFIGNRRTRHTAAVALAGLAAGLLVAAEIRSIGRLNHIQVTDTDGRVVDLSPVYARPQIGFYLAVVLLAALVVGHAIARFRPAQPAGPAHPPPPEPDEAAWADGPPIWAGDDETTASQPPPDTAYREWIDEAWPAAQPPRTASD